MTFEKLFESIRIGNVELKNRVALAPMNTLFEVLTGGLINDQVIAFYIARAKGGFGLIYTGAIIGTRMANQYPYFTNPILYEPKHVGGMFQLTEAVHRIGAKIFAQMWIGAGRQAHAIPGLPPPPAPSPIPFERLDEYLSEDFKILQKKYPNVAKLLGGPVATGDVPREMTVEEIRFEEDEFTNSCLLAAKAGFDGIEIHAAHGYLLHQFLSPRSNQRNDIYGGSLENRMRFLVETTEKVLEKIRKYTRHCAITVRLSADEHMPGGVTHEEIKAVVKKLADLGIDGLQLSSGSYEALKFAYPKEDGSMLNEAASFKNTVDIPIITPSVHAPKLAERALRDSKTDMISLGRQGLCDPDWPNKAREGRIKDIQRCIKCGTCLSRLRLGIPVACPYNPNLGRERFVPEYWPPPAPPRKRKQEEVMPPILTEIVE
jgi:2,4-dienoyl-CoA reductase-like NADH-dependent reductase (Old Yellow Enzyme family)